MIRRLAKPPVATGGLILRTTVFSPPPCPNLRTSCASPPPSANADCTQQRLPRRALPRTSLTGRKAAPALGAHTEAIRREFMAGT